MQFDAVKFHNEDKLNELRNHLTNIKNLKGIISPVSLSIKSCPAEFLQPQSSLIFEKSLKHL